MREVLELGRKVNKLKAACGLSLEVSPSQRRALPALAELHFLLGSFQKLSDVFHQAGFFRVLLVIFVAEKLLLTDGGIFTVKLDRPECPVGHPGFDTKDI